MTTGAGNYQLTQLATRIARQMGLCFPDSRLADLERGVAAAATELGFKDAATCTDWLLSEELDHHQIEVLAAHLTIGETYFFREPQAFAILEREVLPAIRARAGSRHHLRVWSAGCATGEEPYSIAMLLHRALPDLAAWNITLLATDINPDALQRAEHGVYGEWSFRNCPAWLREGYFKTHQNHFEVAPSIKRMVSFGYHNLASDAFPSLLNNTNAFDIIFCRNVLMYFTPEVLERVVRGFYQCLVEGGWLIVSPSEAPCVVSSEFITASYPDITIYRKDGVKLGKALPMPLLRSDNATLPPTPLAERLVAIPSRQRVRARPNESAPDAEAPAAYPAALALFQAGHYAETEDVLRQALGHGEVTPGVFALMARVQANRGELAEALAWCEKAVGAAKMEPTHHFLLAVVMQELGHADAAVQALKRALYLDRDYVPAHIALGNLRRRQGRPRDARERFDNALAALARYAPDEVVPEAEGMTAGRLAELVQATKGPAREE